jgi:hypothetical protein
MKIRFVKRRIEQLNQPFFLADQALVYRLHGLTSPIRIASTADNRPALWQRINLAFQVDMRTERFAVIEISAPIPFAVPALLLDVCLQLFRLRKATVGKGDVVTATSQFSESREHVVEKKGQPNTFAFPFLSDQIHSVVPVAAPHQRQAMYAEFQAVFDRAHAMLIECTRFVGALWQVIIRFFLWFERAAFQKRNQFVKNSGIANRRDIATGDIGQP